MHTWDTWIQKNTLKTSQKMIIITLLTLTAQTKAFLLTQSGKQDEYKYFAKWVSPGTSLRMPEAFLGLALRNNP